MQWVDVRDYVRKLAVSVLLFVTVLVFPANGEDLEIVSAHWGGQKRWVDVTECFGELLNNRVDTFKIANETFKKGDPAPGWKKWVTLTFRFAGETKKVTYHEGTTVCYDQVLSHALGVPYQPKAKNQEALQLLRERQNAPPSVQVLDREQMGGIVVIEGDKGAGSGFITQIKNKKCVVTNLHVLGNNEEFSLRTLAGEKVHVDVNGIIGAVDADIAILTLSEGQEDLTVLPCAIDVLETTKIGSKIVVVGNRLGGGVATQTLGHIRGIGPSTIEVDARFQSGNSGSPIYDVASEEVVGVASYTQNVPVDRVAGGSLAELLLGAETRWFGYRIDTVEKWQSIEWKKWRQQVSRVDAYNKISMGGLAVLQGDFLAAKDEPELWKLITTFRKEGGSFGPNAKTRVLLSQVRNSLSKSRQELDQIKFYDYFESCPYWTTNISKQREFRDKIIDALKTAAD